MIKFNSFSKTLFSASLFIILIFISCKKESDNHIVITGSVTDSETQLPLAGTILKLYNLPSDFTGERRAERFNVLLQHSNSIKPVAETISDSAGSFTIHYQHVNNENLNLEVIGEKEQYFMTGNTKSGDFVPKANNTCEIQMKKN